MKKFLTFIFLFSFYSYSSENFPLTLSLGGAGRAAQGSAEFHILNAATMIQKKSQVSAFYSLNQNYGGSISSQQGLPLALTWVFDPLNQIQNRVISIAGQMNQHWILGSSVRFSSNQTLSPHIGFIYQPIKNLRFGFTGDHIEDNFLYGWGVYYQAFEWLAALADITWEEKRWNFYGGIEMTAQDIFSIRIGQTWPLSFYRLGFSLIGFPIKVDYAWTSEKEHIFGIRFQK